MINEIKSSLGNSGNRADHMEERISKLKNRNLEDGGGVCGHGVHLSPWIHQEYTFRHKSACRTAAESRQEYLTRGKEYIRATQNSVG